MSIGHILEKFNFDNPANITSRTTEEAIEDYRLAAFESGYQAGWDDAASAHNGEDKIKINQLTQNLQELSFTYHEAHSNILLSLQPFLTDLVSVIMPEIARATLVPRVVQEIMNLKAEKMESEIVIKASATSIILLENYLINDLMLAVRFQSDENLTDHEVQFALESGGISININESLLKINSLINDFFSDAVGLVKHG